MKKIFSFILLALLPVVASAYDAYIGGIFYNLSGDEASVTFSDYDEETSTFTPVYRGNVVVPATVTFDGKSYSVTSIGGNAFCDCTNLTSVTIPESVTSIGEQAFSGCENLTSINIPGSVKSIGIYAFVTCKGLTSVTLGDGLTTIGGRAFYECSSLADVTIPGSVKSIGDNTFNGCTSLASLTIKDGVTGIGKGTFMGCRSLTSITLPASVTSIDDAAFSGCSSLASVTIPESVISVGVSAFNGTAWFEKQPQGMVYVGRVAYKYKGEMPEDTEISIKDGTVQIAGYAFDGCTGLASITIPESVTRISTYAFYCCKGLASITFPENVTSIGSYAFSACRNLTSITIPNGVTNISDGVFSGCPNLTSIIIPDGVTRIGEEAFKNCMKLTSVTLPESVTSIGSFAFFGCKGMTSFIIPNKVTSIGFAAFSNCSGLKTVTISSSIKQIDRGAFAACSSLTDVFCLAENVPSTASIAFDSSPIGAATLHVPEASVEKYQKSSPWKNFGSIVPLTSTDVITFTQDQMATIILPTAPDASKGKYFRLDHYEDGKIIFVQELQPQARIPYIIIPNQDFSVEVKETDLEGLSSESVSIDGISFIGTFQRIEISCPEDYYIGIIDITPDCGFSSDETFLIGALRGFLMVPWDDPYNPGGTKIPQEKMEIVLKDDANGINAIQNDEMVNGKLSNGKCFDLSGRKWSMINGQWSMPKGIYIQNGKKYLVK